MTLKKRLAPFVHGWFPDDSNLLVCKQIVQHKNWRTYRRMFFILIVVAAFVGVLLGALGDFLNFTDGIGLYIWSMIISTPMGIIIPTVLVRMKQKEKHQTTVKELKP